MESYETNKLNQANQIARDILQLSRNTLLVNFRFLDMALSGLQPVCDPFATMMTDGKRLCYAPGFILQRYKEADSIPHLTDKDLKALADKAREVIPKRVAYYAPKVGVTYGRITIRTQRTRWGSCSAKGNLNFNCLLMLAPAEVIDSVVVHELCHRKEMDHSDRFYAEVYRVFPEYRKWHQWLKENGSLLLAISED